VGEKGGFAPSVGSPEEVLGLLVGAIADAGYAVGRGGVALALAPAVGPRRAGGRYLFGGDLLTTDGLIDRYEHLVDRFPVVAIEDGLAEDDVSGWARLTARLGDRALIVAGDACATDPVRAAAATGQGLANAVLVKANQVGTVTEALETARVCREAGWAVMVSDRAGETGDPFPVDLAVGTGCGLLKSGFPVGAERAAFRRRLLALEQQHPALRYGAG
jgi:enolase